MVLPDIEACLFDFDGCLADTSRPIIVAMNATLASRGLTSIDEAEMFPYVGPPLLGSMVAILGDRGADPSLAAEAVDDYRAEFKSIAVEMAGTFPGVPELLDRLSGLVRLGVVTSKPGVYAMPVLDRLGFTRYFEFVEGASLAETEQKPETLARGLQHFGDDFELSRAVMVGDRHFDVEAAIANGIPSVGVTWGFGTRDELEGAGATLVIDQPSELAEAVL